MTSRAACIIQSLCGVTSSRTGPDPNPSEETEGDLSSDFSRNCYEPLILINKTNLSWHVIVKSIAGTQAEAHKFSNFLHRQTPFH